MECEPGGGKKLCKVFEASKRASRMNGDHSTDTDGSKSAILNRQNSKSRVAALEKKASSGGSSRGFGNTSAPPPVPSHTPHPTRRNVKKKQPSLALKPACVSPPLSDSPDVTPRSIPEPKHAVTDANVDPGRYIHDFLEEAVKKKKHKHHRRQEERSALSADRRRRRSKRDDVSVSSTRLVETFVKLLSQAQDPSRQKDPAVEALKIKSNGSIQCQHEEYSDIDRKPSKLCEDIPPREYRNKHHSRDDVSDTASFDNMESRRHKKPSPRCAEPHERTREINSRNSKYTSLRHGEVKRKERYNTFRDKCPSNEQFCTDCIERCGKKHIETYGSNENYCPHERYGPSEKCASERPINRYGDRIYEERPPKDRYSDRVLDEKPNYAQSRPTRWTYEEPLCMDKNERRYVKRYQEERDYVRDDIPHRPRRRLPNDKNYLRDIRYDERNCKATLDSPNLDVESEGNGNESDVYEATITCMRNEPSFNQKNRAQAEKEFPIDSHLMGEVAEQREAIDKMMRLWQEAMKRFKDVSDNVGRSERIVQDTAAAVRECATTQMQLWRECMQRYDSVARDVGESDARLKEEMQKQKSEMCEMSSMWQECLTRYREMSSHLTTLKQQIAEPAPALPPPPPPAHPLPAAAQEGDAPSMSHPYTMLPQHGYPMMYGGSPMRARASAPAAPPPPWWWRGGSPHARRQSSADSSEVSRRRDRHHRQRERVRDKNRSKERSTSKVDARSERRRRK